MRFQIETLNSHSKQGGVGRDERLVDPLDLHFGPGETGEFATSAVVIGHGSSFCWLEFKR